MDWFSFIAGALTGWIVEWLIDLFYWRRKQSRWANEHNRLESDLSHAQNTVSGLRTREVELNQQLSVSRGDVDAANSNLSILQADLDGARAEIAALNNQLSLADADKLALADQLNNDLAAAQAEAGDLREQLSRALAANKVLQSENTMLGTRRDELESDAARFLAVSGLSVAAAAAAQPEQERDDLTIIEGIGPKIEELLNQHDIYTFARLADASVPDLETIIRSAGSRFQTANPETWPRQARLAANKDWTRLDALKAQLQGGVRRPSAVEVAAVAAAAAAAAEPPKPPSDDLTIIEGIGPKIEELLNQHGIRTFQELADTSVPDLEAILRGAGSRFQTANPETWPRQARLAANKDWPRLDALKAELVGGVRRAAAEPQDDLAVIEGIGPKIAEILYQNGIKTYGQLARIEPARLRLILDEAGPAYRVADPTSWPEQASWAAVGNWARLQVLKDELNAGRRQM